MLKKNEDIRLFYDCISMVKNVIKGSFFLFQKSKVLVFEGNSYEGMLKKWRY